MMASTYSVSSFEGLVSSKRRLHLPPNSAANPKSRQIALAWPMCRYPFGSGGKRVCTRPPCLPVLMSSIMMSRIKFDRPPDPSGDSTDDSSGLAPESVPNEFICLSYLLMRDWRRTGEVQNVAPVCGFAPSLSETDYISSSRSNARRTICADSTLRLLLGSSQRGSRSNQRLQGGILHRFRRLD